ncbi:MAG TPA: MFS transporter [Hyphomonadaceae bacterium]|nr:MFS transporter [Hyphomonadaceae bacterium]
MAGTAHPFRSLRTYNYRLWAAGALVSNVGTWMQRVAQDWLVLTVLTHNNATAVGIVTALQFGPQLFLLPVTGWAADHIDRRRLLATTQASLGLLALGLGLLIITGLVQLWQVYAFALTLGCVTAFDAPARQTFVAELVGDADLSNAVALNSASFNAGRMLGPAAAGFILAAVGSGWVFIINAASFLAVLTSLGFLKTSLLHRHDRPERTRGSFTQGFRYVQSRADLKAILLMLFLLGALGFNFPICISTMSVKAFHIEAKEFGLLTSTMAIGSVIGALMSARREKPRLDLLGGSALVFGCGCALAAVMPNYLAFGLVLVVIGAAAQTFTTSAIGLTQLSTDKALRGRVMAILLGVTFGGTLIGGPTVGWIADAFGPRWAMAMGAVAGLGSAAIALGYRLKYGAAASSGLA